MDFSLTQILAAMVMVGLGIVLVLVYRSYLNRKSERRMVAMLEALGLDPDIATSGDMQTIMGEVRQRCRSCTSEAVCERWLRVELDGDNDFCPNHRVFEILDKYGGAAR